MKAKLPDAVVMTDDEISAAIASHLHEREWASQDEFCRQLFDEMNNYLFADDDAPNSYTNDYRPAYHMGVHAKEKASSTQCYGIAFTKNLMTMIKEYKTTEPVLQDVFDMMNAMPDNMRVHQVTDDLRLLLSLCHATRTFMHRSELNALIDKVEAQYDFEIIHMQNLYR